MDNEDGVRRRYYGIAEIADSLGLGRQLVTVWRKRRSHGMPEPDAELASGPLWLGATVEPWIDRVRAKDEVEPTPRDLVLRTCRRVLRLAVALLDDPARTRVLSQALHEVRELLPAVEAAPPDAAGTALRALVKSLDLDADPGADLDGLRRRVLAALPAIAGVAEPDERRAGRA
ncbi:hypothetical protein [Actinosynnema sp. NPDC020468]|uniref:hypothetical protein n=1 Tax=Actinosynnema sp. NPDC020468 TaxID=3154488 RepID=UPI0034004E30